MRRARAALLAVLAPLACGDAPGDGAGVRADTAGAPSFEAGEAPAADSVPTRIFLREPAPDAPPGRLTLHVVVPGDATREQIRQALVRTLEGAAAEDSALVAARAIAYAVADPEGRPEAEVVPLGWGEWLPPGGWAAPEARRGEPHRVTTYFGTPPEW